MDSEIIIYWVDGKNPPRFLPLETIEVLPDLVPTIPTTLEPPETVNVQIID